jgi:hypothetical protein
LILAVLLALASLYLPWLPGLYGPVPGWKVPYAAPDVSLDQIRHLEAVARPDSLFLLSFVSIVAFLLCRTSRYAGVRDIVAAVVLVAGGGYLLVYFADEWGWCLSYNYVGPYAAFASLILMVISGLLRSKFMPWISRDRILLLLASAFLVTGWFMPWSKDYTGVELLLVSREFYWLGSARIYTLLMPIFPLLGVVAFAAAFVELPAIPRFMQKCWPLCFGLAALAYFRAFWATYLVGFPLGSWGTLAGLSILTVAGFYHACHRNTFVARAFAWSFVPASVIAWFAFITGKSFWSVLTGFFSGVRVFRF